MATVDTILEKIDGIKNSKENIVSVLKEGGVVVPDNTQLSAIPKYIKEVSYSGDLPAHEATIADSTTYGHVRLATNMNDNGSGVVPSTKTVNDELLNHYVSKDNLNGGIETQSICGYDSSTGERTDNAIYLDDNNLVVHSGGEEIHFPNKRGTVALTSDIIIPAPATKTTYGTVKISSTLEETTDNIVPSISQVNTLLDDKANTSQVFRDTREVAQNASDGIANLFGWSGTLRDLNVSFERVGISTLSLKKRTGSAPSNTAYARIVHIGSSGTVEMLFQSKKQRFLGKCCCWGSCYL